MSNGTGHWSERYESVIGLEIHVQLSTRTKMFCGCELSFGDRPNSHTCPVCLAHPGALPVVNAEAIDYGIKIGLALGCEIAPRSVFHRKNYFYPDSAKAYQISQFDIPIAANGMLDGIRIHRAHLEEDAAKLTHVGGSGRIHGSGSSLVDFNRGGTPLVEIVTEPDLRSAAQVREWAQLLRTTVRSLDVSNVNMEEGSLRCDANISLRPVGTTGLGVKTELKNMNSFRYIERGIEAEILRQAAILDAGGRVEQETLHFDPKSGSLTSLRSKEEAHDYRYFPEPDLVPIVPSASQLEGIRASLPELPAQRRQRYLDDYGLTDELATQLGYETELGEFFDRTLVEAGETSPKLVANWVAGELLPRLRGGSDSEVAEDLAASKVGPAALAVLATMVGAKEVTTAAARQVLDTMVETGEPASTIVEREGLAQISGEGDEMDDIIARAIASDPAAAAKVRAGNMAAIGPIIGFVMRETKGRADGGEVTRLVRAKLA